MCPAESKHFPRLSVRTHSLSPTRLFDRLALEAERSENIHRLEPTPSEKVALGRRHKRHEGAAAKERLKEAGRVGGKGSGKLPEASTGDTRDKVGAAVGLSGKSYEKAEQVVEAAEGDPEKFGDLPGLMDSKSIDAAHRMLSTFPHDHSAPDAPDRDYPSVCHRPSVARIVKSRSPRSRT